MLLFPPTIGPDQETPQEFALQFWDEQKFKNASLVVSIIGIMVTLPGHDIFGSLILVVENSRAYTTVGGTWDCFKCSNTVEDAGTSTSLWLQSNPSILPNHHTLQPGP